MKIRFTLKYGDQDDLVDPFGDIFITDGRVTISEPDTFLYGWFDSLIVGLEKLRAGKSSRGFVEEPHNLFFEPTNGGAQIIYGGTTIIIYDVEQLEKAVRDASKELVSGLHRIGKPVRNVFLDRIMSFIDE